MAAATSISAAAWACSHLYCQACCAACTMAGAGAARALLPNSFQKAYHQTRLLLPTHTHSHTPPGNQGSLAWVSPCVLQWSCLSVRVAVLIVPQEKADNSRLADIIHPTDRPSRYLGLMINMYETAASVAIIKCTLARSVDASVCVPSLACPGHCPGPFPCLPQKRMLIAPSSCHSYAVHGSTLVQQNH